MGMGNGEGPRGSGRDNHGDHIRGPASCRWRSTAWRRCGPVTPVASGKLVVLFPKRPNARRDF
eukprot:scaffold25484_cov112-Isochrysis_galbana.AAC.1